MNTSAPTSPGSTKPRIALMGEFSAGKSTLANLLLEQAHSPVQVTATHLPPVWYSYGAGPAHQVTIEGTREPVRKPHWRDVSLSEAQLIEVQLEGDVLEAADLIDLPGTCDPNLPTRYWETLVTQVDIVIWCTPAHQAWRQSEAALWDTMPEELKPRSLLLITRMDKIRSEVDRARILRRTQHEAGHLFGQVTAISLTDALTTPTDDTVLEECGASHMVQFLISSLEKVGLTQREPFVPNCSVVETVPTISVARSAPSPGQVVPRRIGRRSLQAAGGRTI